MINKTPGFWILVIVFSVIIFLIQGFVDELFYTMPFATYVFIPYWVGSWLIFPFPDLYSTIAVPVATYIVSLLMAFFLLHIVHLYMNFKHD